MTTPSAEWWQGALSSTPIFWREGRAYFVEPEEKIAIDQEGKGDKRRWSNMRHHHFNWLERKLATLPDDSHLIDIGAGPVQFKALTDRYNVCNIDHQPYPPINIVSDIESPIPLDNSCAQAILLSNVLEHVLEPKKLLQECVRLLQPGGTMFLVVPFLIKEHQTPRDYFRYTRFALERLAQDVGFSDVTVEAVGNLFDVYDIDRWARAQNIRTKTSGLQKLSARSLLKIQNVTESLLRSVLPDELTGEEDDLGFPQSFGMIARNGSA